MMTSTDADCGGRHICDRCTRELAVNNEYMANRMEYWKSSYNLLHMEDHEWPEDLPVSQRDVLDLAKFLAGEADE